MIYPQLYELKKQFIFNNLFAHTYMVYVYMLYLMFTFD